jgi:fused signal recognition particle receptor
MPEFVTEHETVKVTKFDPETGESTETLTEVRTDISPDPEPAPETIIVEEIPTWMTEQLASANLKAETAEALLQVAQATVAMLETERDGLAAKVAGLEKMAAPPSPEPEPDPPSPSEPGEEPEIVLERRPASDPASEPEPVPVPENDPEQKRKRLRLII